MRPVPRALLITTAMATVCDAQAEPATSLRDLGRQYEACTRIPQVPPGAEGSWVRLRFSIRRDGSLFGQPRIDDSRLTGDAEAQRAFRAAAIADFARCFPISVTDDFGGAIAGRILRVRVSGR